MMLVDIGPGYRPSQLRSAVDHALFQSVVYHDERATRAASGLHAGLEEYLLRVPGRVAPRRFHGRLNRECAGAFLREAGIPGEEVEEIMVANDLYQALEGIFAAPFVEAPGYMAEGLPRSRGLVLAGKTPVTARDDSFLFRVHRNGSVEWRFTTSEMPLRRLLGKLERNGTPSYIVKGLPAHDFSPRRQSRLARRLSRVYRHMKRQASPLYPEEPEQLPERLAARAQIHLPEA